MAKNLPADAENASGLIPGLGRSPGVGNDTHCSIVAWEVRWAEEPSRLQSMGPQKPYSWPSVLCFTRLQRHQDHALSIDC